MAAGFADGVDLVDLAPVTDAASLPAVLTRALDLEEWEEAAIEDRLVELLGGQRRLVVLDNCEHLRVACADMVSRLLSWCPRLVVLATSRESLRMPGEITRRVPSLSFPWPDHLPAMKEVEDYEAVALFLDRARSARPGFVMTPDDVAPVTQICYRLDGIPLALELAAARMSALSLPEIAQRISGRFDLLAAAGTGPAHHQTLQASVEWSHQLLDDVEGAVPACRSVRRRLVLGRRRSGGGRRADRRHPGGGRPGPPGRQVLSRRRSVRTGQPLPAAKDDQGLLAPTVVDSGEIDRFSRRPPNISPTWLPDRDRVSAARIRPAGPVCWTERMPTFGPPEPGVTSIPAGPGSGWP